MCGNYLSRFIITTIFLLIFSTFTFAQGIVSLDDIVVTATRIKKKNYDIPTPIEVISQKYLEINNPQSFNSPLMFLPGVDIANSGFWESTPIIRGLGANRVLVLYDGDRETNTWAGRAPLTPFLDISDVEKIEVVKGPASVLYGTDALGGVINIITKHPDYAHLKKFTIRNKFSGRYSSVDDGYIGTYTLEGGAKGFDFRFFISGRDTDDYDDGKGNKVNNSFLEDSRIDFKARYIIHDKHEILFNYKRNSIDDMGVPQKVTTGYSHFTKFDSDIFKIKYNGDDIGFFKNINLSTWYVNQERNYKGLFYSSKKPVHVIKNNDIDTYSYGISFQGNIHIKSNNIITGIDYVYENTDSEEFQLYQKNNKNINIKEFHFNPLSNSERYHLGIFLQDEINITKKFKILAGIRYDYFVADGDDNPFVIKIYDPKGLNIVRTTTSIQNFERDIDSAVTYNLGILYKLTPYIHLTSNFSSGFRAPDVFERYSTRGGSFIIIGNPDLDSEYSYNFDVGIKFKYEKIKGAFNVFYNRVNDYIDFIKKGETFAGLPVYKYINVADTEFYGYDGSIEINLLKELVFFGNIAYVVGENRDTDQRLNLIPPLNGVLGIKISSEINKLKYWAELNSTIYDRQRHPGPAEEETAGYAVFNFISGIKFNYKKIQNITLTFNIDNLFDKNYKRHLTLSKLSNRIYEPGRSFNFGLKFSF